MGGPGAFGAARKLTNILRNYGGLVSSRFHPYTQTHPASGLQGLLPDGLHPNAAGMELIAECLEESLAPFLGSAVNNTFPRTALTRHFESTRPELPC